MPVHYAVHTYGQEEMSVNAEGIQHSRHMLH